MIGLDSSAWETTDDVITLYPEFLDSNGNYIQEELLAVRFIDDEPESEDD